MPEDGDRARKSKAKWNRDQEAWGSCSRDVCTKMQVEEKLRLRRGGRTRRS